MQLKPDMRLHRGFTLVELAVVLGILALLMSSLMYTLSAQSEQRAREETQRRLDQAREALLGYAVAHGRLPCPAAGVNGKESETAAGNGDCTDNYGGFLPAVTIGFQQVDAQGFALDAWNNRIRYAVVRNLETSTCAGTSDTPHFTLKTNLKRNGMSCLPDDLELIVCKSSASSTPPSPGTCGTADNWVTGERGVVAVVFSPGKNYPLAPSSAAATATGKADEAENLDGDTIFISHTPQPEGATGGEFDDMVVWIPVGLFYGRLAAAGVLP